MIRAEYILVLTAAFFIREAIQKKNDYNLGYKRAIRDIAHKYNEIINQGTTYKVFVEKMRDFIQAKLNGGG